MYTRDWYKANVCNAIYCTIQNRDVIWLHSKKCMSKDDPCNWVPGTTKLKHFDLNTITNTNEILWASILEELRL